MNKQPLFIEKYMSTKIKQICYKIKQNQMSSKTNFFPKNQQRINIATFAVLLGAKILRFTRKQSKLLLLARVLSSWAKTLLPHVKIAVAYLLNFQDNF
jgi:hypothetical protein